MTTGRTVACHHLRVLAALGRGIARRPGLIVLVWIVLTLAGFALATGVVGEGLFARLETGEASVSSESSEGRAILNAASTTGPTLTLLVQHANPADPALEGPLAAARADLLAIPGMATVVDPWAVPGGPAGPAAAQVAALIAEDGDGFLVSAMLQPTYPRTSKIPLWTPPRRGWASWAPRSPHCSPGRPHRSAAAPCVSAITGQVEKDLVRGELIALPISLLVMVLVFGGFLAAGMPIVGAIASIGGGLAMLLGFSYLIDLDASVVNVVTVLALGLCIDYGLLIVSRFREELRDRLSARPPARRRRPETTPWSPPCDRRPHSDVLRRDGRDQPVRPAGVPGDDPAGGRRRRRQRRGGGTAGRVDPGAGPAGTGRRPG